MTKFSSLLAVLLLMLVSFTANSQDYPRGDVSQDGNVSISDVTCLIDYLLSGTWPDEPVTPPDDHEWVDLGLPSGTLWATCNVGANAPEEFGDYFAWGETAPKDYYDWDNYKWCNGNDSTLTKYCNDSTYGYNGFVDNKVELDPEDDAAYVNWGPSWRMPTLNQTQELWQDCTWQWTQVNGVNGRLVTGPNGNTLFMPAAGQCVNNGANIGVGIWGVTWARRLGPNFPFEAFDPVFESDYMDWFVYGPRDVGYTVRAVRVQ